MGIKLLNTFIKQKCNKGIDLIKIEELRGKTIVIDTSIYLYRYIGENNLIDNFYLMITLFKINNITPIFIFDGKPKDNKRDMLTKRSEQKRIAQEEYDKLLDKYNNEKDIDKRKELEMNIGIIGKKITRVNWGHIDEVKELMDNYGINYIVAPHEADELCVKLVLNGTAYGCMSEDMDMFVYGCPVVLRYISLINRTVVRYNLKIILEELDITLEDFRYLCILSGTDYNITTQTIFNNYQKYIKYNSSREDNYIEYINKIYTDIDIATIIGTYYTFDIYDKEYEYLDIYDHYKIDNKEVKELELREILERNNFIFLD